VPDVLVGVENMAPEGRHRLPAIVVAAILRAVRHAEPGECDGDANLPS
jgi:hypothetical protein